MVSRTGSGRDRKTERTEQGRIAGSARRFLSMMVSVTLEVLRVKLLKALKFHLDE